MLNSKIRTAAVIASLALPVAAAGPASAAKAHHAGSTTVRPVVKHNVSVALQAGSAGISGYDDKACEGLANDFNKAVEEQEGGLLEGNKERQDKYGELGKKILGQMTDNCLVVY